MSNVALYTFGLLNQATGPIRMAELVRREVKFNTRDSGRLAGKGAALE
jgi:hypothetical protein